MSQHIQYDQYETADTRVLETGEGQGLIVERSGAAVPSMNLRMLFSSQRATRVPYLRVTTELLSQVTTCSKRFAALFKKLDQIQLATEQWTRTMPKPSEDSLSEARALLGRLRASNFVPSRVMPSAEGGIGICFEDGERYADFECTNDGRITGVISDRKGFVEAFAVDRSFEGESQAIAKVREFLGA